MITFEESIPTKSETYKTGEDIFYSQFNEIFFYIEDDEHENFFFCILKNLFPDIRLEKIFPLGGKTNVISESKENLGDKKKVYIVDKDFDDLFNIVERLPNLFYLKKYSIENYLIEKNAIVNYIIGERPRLKKNEVNRAFNFSASISNICYSLKDIINLHLVVQYNSLELRNVSVSYEKYLGYENGNFIHKEREINIYKQDIINELATKDKRKSIDGQLRKISSFIYFRHRNSCIKHIPGKYLIKMIKKHIDSLFGLATRSNDSFCYRLAEHCEFNSLAYLKTKIEKYIS